MKLQIKDDKNIIHDVYKWIEESDRYGNHVSEQVWTKKTQNNKGQVHWTIGIGCKWYNINNSLLI